MKTLFLFASVWLFALAGSGQAHADGVCDAVYGEMSEESAAQLVDQVLVEMKVADRAQHQKIFNGAALKVPAFYDKMKPDYELAKAEGERIRESVRALDGKIQTVAIGGLMSFRERLFALGHLYDKANLVDEKKLVLKSMMVGFTIAHEPDYFALLASRAHSVEVRTAVYTALSKIFNNGVYSFALWAKPMEEAMRAGGL